MIIIASMSLEDETMVLIGAQIHVCMHVCMVPYVIIIAEVSHAEDDTVAVIGVQIHVCNSKLNLNNQISSLLTNK